MAQNILVVEDDRLNRELFSKVLRQEGYQVLEACDGDIALKILQGIAMRSCDHGFFDAHVERN